MASAVLYTPSLALFQHARLALQGIEEEKHSDDIAPNQFNALTAIVFSAFTLEAFINEVGDYAAYVSERTPSENPSVIKQLGSVLQELKDQRSGGSIETKYVMAKWVLDGAPYDRGRSPYQDFKLLISLRNALAHVEGMEIYDVTTSGPTRYTEKPSIIDRLDDKHILAEGRAGGAGPSSWFERLWTLAAARWACRTTSAMIRSLIAAMLDSSFGALWRGVYDFAYTVPGGPPKFTP